MRDSQATRSRRILSEIVFGVGAKSGTRGGCGLTRIQIGLRHIEMVEYKSALKSTLEAREVRSQRLHEILRTPDDVIGLVLRGHLFIEELLFAAVEAHCKDAEEFR